MGTRIRLLIVFGVAAGVLAAVATPSAFATDYPPPPTPDCIVKPTAVHPRQGVTLIGDHWHHHAAVVITFQQGQLTAHLSSPITGFTGRFVTVGVIPRQARRGAAVVLFRGLFRGHHARFKYRCSVLEHVRRPGHDIASTNAGYAVTPMGFVPRWDSFPSCSWGGWA